MKELPLSNGGTFIVDDEDALWAQNFSWFRGGQCKRSSTFTGQTGYPTAMFPDPVTGKKKLVKFASIVMPPLGPLVVDHINRNPLDNRRANLRYVTKSENLHNTTVRCDSTTGFKCVSPHSRRKGVYTVRAWFGGRKFFVGNYPSKVDAAKAYVNFMDEARKHPELLPPTGRRKNNTSGYRGVTRSGSKWMARVMVDGVSNYLGMFSTPEEANKAVKAFKR